MRSKIVRRPKYLRSGEMAYVLPRSYLREKHEVLLITALITNRYLFGLVYAGMVPNYFFRMPEKSGVFVAVNVHTELLSTRVTKPGDIDLLIIPYEGDFLVLDQIVAIEVKAIRARFVNQGKSPNSLGMSQADGLIKIGFPYVGVAHLIVSDESPEELWRPMGVFRVLDEYGRCEPLPDLDVDWMPVDLMARAIGKMEAACENKSVGLAAVYLGSKDEHFAGGRGNDGAWHPDVRKAVYNEQFDRELVLRVASLLEAKPQAFMDIPRFDP